MAPVAAIAGAAGGAGTGAPGDDELTACNGCNAGGGCGTGGANATGAAPSADAVVGAVVSSVDFPDSALLLSPCCDRRLFPPLADLPNRPSCSGDTVPTFVAGVVGPLR